MRHVFGPVRSRRLGRSLGIDPLVAKTCNYSCVYCQLGRTACPVNERRAYVPLDAVLAELRDALLQVGPEGLDWITVVGSGEPTLSADLGRLLGAVKELSSLPLAVVTNGSLLWREPVRRELQAADAVLPSLDAGSPELFQRIARPHPQCSFEGLVEGLVAFERDCPHRTRLEIMLLRGLNDDEAALRDIAAVVDRIDPLEVCLNVPTRPAAEGGVQPPTSEALARAVELIGHGAEVVAPSSGAPGGAAGDDLHGAVLAILARHPMGSSELQGCLARWSAHEVGQALSSLEHQGQIHGIRYQAERYWRVGSPAPSAPSAPAGAGASVPPASASTAVKVVLDLSQHCIETAARQVQRRLLQEHLQSRSPSEESEATADDHGQPLRLRQLELVQDFIERADFGALRARHALLRGGSPAVRVTLQWGADGRAQWSLG